jgi:hypothetical protein
MNKEIVVKYLMAISDNRRGTNEQLQLIAQKYRTGYLALSFLCANGEPFDNVTLAFPDVSAPADSVFIKNYSSGEGNVELLISHGVIESEVVASVRSGYVTVNAYQLSQTILQKLAN